MMTKPIKTLELHYPMIQFLIDIIVLDYHWEEMYMRYITGPKTDSWGTSAYRTRLLEVTIYVILRIYKI